MDSWLEWEERCLRPAVHGGDSAALGAAVGRLASALGASGGQFLAGGQLSLADIVVYATLRPLAGGNSPAGRCMPCRPWLCAVDG